MNQSTVLRHTWRTCLSVIVVTASIEAGARMGGLIDFPIYDANSTVGYIPRASQQGRFLNRNEWSINERHMQAGPFAPGSGPNVLLVGDSIVWGGNSYREAEKLSSHLRGRIDAQIWPVSAGSWTLHNEVAYLENNVDVVGQVQTVAFVLNSGDLAPASSWRCPVSHPTERPWLATWYLMKKHVLRWTCEPDAPAALRVPPADPLQLLARFAAIHGDRVRIVVFLYPDAEEAADETLLAQRLETMAPRLAAAGVREIVSIGRDPRWNEGSLLYRDPIHPTAEGNARLAEIIADTLRSSGVRPKL